MKSKILGLLEKLSPTRAIQSLIGDVRWTPAPWIQSVHSGASRASSKTGIGWRQIAVILVTVGAGWEGYQFLGKMYGQFPQIKTVDWKIEAPSPTPLVENAKVDSLGIRFDESVMRLSESGRALEKGIQISPPIPGTWKWESSRKLIFRPNIDWKISTKYTVTLSKDLFENHVLLNRYQDKFSTQAFTANITKSFLYEDPLDPKKKTIEATVRFNYPVDTDDFKKRVRLTFGESRKDYGFAVTFNGFKGEAYIHSDPIALPDRDSAMNIVVEGARTATGGVEQNSPAETEVKIAGVYNYFRVLNASIQLIPNEKFELDQVLMIGFTSELTEKEFRSHVKILQLPVADNKIGRKSSGQITPEVLSQSKKVSFELLPNEKDASSRYSLKLSAPVGTDLLVQVDKGTQSVGEYILSDAYAQIVRIPEYPKEVRIMSSGSILSLSGEKKLAVMSRGIEAIRFRVGRVIPGFINHLISQTDGNMVKPHFQSYNFGEENLSEELISIQEIEQADPRVNRYSSLALDRYLHGEGTASDKKGLFFVKAEPWNAKTKSSANGSADQRFILVTNLGVLVKVSADRSQDVFVQSIHNGSPVAGAKVELIGKNGLPILTVVTDGQGRASLPPTDGFEKEKSPTAYIVRKDGDLSFLPFNHYTRRLNYSRFDISGEYTEGDDSKLKAFLFSERGLYRPGDDIHVGMIVKAEDWSQPLSGVPVEAVIQDARGVQVLSQRMELTKEGFSEIKHQTEESSPTGNYSFSLYILDDKGRRSTQIGATQVRVEEFLPDTLKILTKLSSERTEGWVSPKDIKGLVSLRNLFGTAAEKRKISSTFSVSPTYPKFRQYKDYTFADPVQAKTSQEERLEDTETNEKGEAEIPIDLKRFEATSFRLVFTAEGYETEGGRGVTAQASTLVSPLDYLVGYKVDGSLGYIKKGSSRNLEFIAISPNLKQTKAGQIKLHLIEKRAVSVLTRQDDDTYAYQSVHKEVPVSTTEIAISEKGYKYALPTTQPGDFIVSLKDPKDREISRFEFSVVGQANLARKLDKNAELQIKLSKTDYAPGEDIELQITAPYTGAGLITLESDKIYASQWFKTSTTASVQRIRVPASLEGSGYVNVAFVRASDSKEIFTSPLSYGAVPFSVSKDRRVTKIKLEAPELVKPGDPFKISYSTNQLAKIAIFAVDEGILQVAAYKTPDPIAHFFKKRALEVQTSQLLDLILPEFSLIKALSSTGGDEGANALGKNLNPFKRKRDKPVVFWSGIIDAGPETRDVTYNIPDYFNGGLRVMAVAVTNSTIGSIDRKAIVRGDFIITPTIPTFVTPDDEIEVGVSLANSAEGSGPEAEVQLELKVSEHLELTDQAIRKIKVGEGREAATTYKLKAKNVLGSGNLTFKASLGPKKSSRSVDLSVRPASPYVTTLWADALTGDKAETKLERKTFPHFAKREVAISATPLAMGQGLMQYLDEYPYGCTEQLISKAFPAIALKSRPEFGVTAQKAEERYQFALRILRSRLTPEGGFGAYSSDLAGSDFYSVYAYHFLTEAAEKGFSVPKDLVTRVREHLETIVKREPGQLGEGRVNAYALYLLARSGVLAANDLAGLRRTLDKNHKDSWKSDIAGIFLAATYQLYKQEGEAQGLIQTVRFADRAKYDDYSYMDSMARDGQLLYILSKHFPDRAKEIDANYLQGVAKSVTSGRYNSLNSAYTLLGLEAFATQAGNPTTLNAALTSKAGSTDWKNIVIPTGLFPKVSLDLNTDQVRITNPSKSLLFSQVTQAGFDVTPPKTELKQKLEISREITDENGSAVKEAKLGKEYQVHVRIRSIGEAKVDNVAVIDLLPSGFEVVLAKSHEAERATESEDDEAHGQPSDGDEPYDTGGDHAYPEDEADMPSWDESEGARLDSPQKYQSHTSRDQITLRRAQADRSPAAEAGLSLSTWRPQYVDIREDRVLIYGTATQEAQEFIYKVKAISRGTFVIPPIYAESMYDRKIQARGLGGKIQVVKE